MAHRCPECGQEFDTREQHDMHHEMAHMGEKGGMVEDIKDSMSGIGERTEDALDDIENRVN